MSELTIKGKAAKDASKILAQLSSDRKNEILKKAAQALMENTEMILKENELDMKDAEANGISGSLLDRLRLTEDRIKSMSEGLMQLCALNDPVGDVLWMKQRSNGLKIGKKRVPMGVIGIIYEARPNVTVDAFGLCFKTNNAVILRGGKEAIHSNIVLVKTLQNILDKEGIPKEAIQIVEDTNRATATEMMRLNEYLDVLIPRGGAGLIKAVVENSTVPIIETGTGNCHVYVDSEADYEKALKIADNAKTHRPGVCNACETLLVHETLAERFIPDICKIFKEKNVEVRGDETVKRLFSEAILATEEDWATEYLDLKIAVKTVSSFEEAVDHINTYSTGHSEAIVTESYTKAQKFLDLIDSAAVYVNASTRFTDGFEFGFGAEIGISTQKLHARGPMGLEELTTTKYIIYGDGQIRK
ncbi:MAG: glutamate-5-semialdehyde dehydrogenase [Eubacteriaceae bacterium]|nr:glutamate-5-semialdehyde dehydrogenase [Eubacteriaceae bacterium]